MTIKGVNLCIIITNKGIILEIEHNRIDEKLYNFETVVVLGEDKTPFHFDPYLNLNVNAILKK